MALVAGATIQVERLQFFDEHPIKNSKDEDAYPGCSGAVWYLVLVPCTCKTPCEICCATHPGQHHSYLMQPFSFDGQKFRPGSTPEEQRENRANVWAWDGNRQAATVTPSFLCLWSGPRVHSFLKAGRIELCGDSELILHPSPAACVDLPAAS